MASTDTNEDDNLEILLAKATNPLHKEPDADAVVDFCSMIDGDHDGPQTALRLLSHKIQSPIEKESLMALTVLEECVKKCGPRFRTEIGKFRFLNEMIKVVSPKYLGNRASPKVKQRIVEIMYIWSLELRTESKIAEVYQMLKRQGVVIEDPVYLLDNYEPPPPPPPRLENSNFTDKEKDQQLQKLLRSKNAEDLQAANRLIKNMVREADKKMEMMAKRSTELETVHNNASVLADMLEHYKAGETSDEEKELMKELFESCKRLMPKLFRLAGELDEKDKGLSDTLKVNDELKIVINNYNQIMGVPSKNGTATSGSKTASLLDLGSPVQQSDGSCANTSLLVEHLIDLGISDINMKGVPGPSSQMKPTSSALADLEGIFNSAPPHQTLSPKPFLPSVINLPRKASSLTSTVSPSVPVVTASKGLEELDEIGQSLKKSLPIASSVTESTPKKVPVSQLMQQQLDSSDVPCLMSTSLDKISPTSSPSHRGILSMTDVFVPLETILPGNRIEDCTKDYDKNIKNDPQHPRRYKRYTDEQKEIMIRYFKQNPNPPDHVIHHIAHLVGETFDRIFTWFCAERYRKGIRKSTTNQVHFSNTTILGDVKIVQNQESVEVVNQAEGILHDTESKMEAFKSQLPEEEVTKIKMKEVRQLIANKDSESPKTLSNATHELKLSWLELFEAVYKRESVEVVNQAEGILHDTESKMEAFESQLPEEEVMKIKIKMKEVRQLIANKDSETPKTLSNATHELKLSWLELFEAVYKRMASESSCDNSSSTEETTEQKKEEKNQ